MGAFFLVAFFLVAGISAGAGAETATGASVGAELSATSFSANEENVVGELTSTEASLD